MKDIKDYEGLYKINKDGEVFSTRSNKILKTYFDSAIDQFYIYLRKNKKRKKFYIYDLVVDNFPVNKKEKKIKPKKEKIIIKKPSIKKNSIKIKKIHGLENIKSIN